MQRLSIAFANSSSVKCCASPRATSRTLEFARNLLEISDVADVCLETVWQICRQQLVERHGTPYQSGCAKASWHPTAVLRARHGQTRRTGTQLQFGRGCAFRLQPRRAACSKTARRAKSASTPREPILTESSVLQSPGRSIHRRSRPR